MRIKNVRCIPLKVKQFVLLMLIVLICFVFSSAARANDPKSEKKLEFAPPVEKGADQLFKEAAAIAQKNPEEAIRLYQRALLSKPDAWEERKKTALLYEKLEKIDAALKEYESINSAVDSAQSNADLIRILEKRALLPVAVSIALHGAQKFPDDTGLSLSAGTLLLKTGQADTAVEFIKGATQNKPGDKDLLFLLGQAYEQQGNGALALRAYLGSMDAEARNDKYEVIFQRLAQAAVRVDDVWFFLPRGWERDKNMLFNTMEDLRVYVDAHPEGDMDAVALKVVKEKMPPGMFDDEQVKWYEEMRKMASKMSKESPDAVKVMNIDSLPFFITKPLSGKMQGLLVLASSSKVPSELLQTACALVFLSKNRVYTVTCASSKSYQEVEKDLLSLLDYIVFPL